MRCPEAHGDRFSDVTFALALAGAYMYPLNDHLAGSESQMFPEPARAWS